ncbi:MAG: cell division protein ZapE, partial [Pseudomonadales bacterium]|nr:cell division protein ZapE [Pseudomonadales bacterium]
MTPLERYKRDLESADFSYDEAQERAVTHLDRLYHDLVLRAQKAEVKGFFS